MQNQKSETTGQSLNELPKTLVLVHPGSTFGSARDILDFDSHRCRDKIAKQILEHEGNFVVIDGFLSDEIDKSFNDVIEKGMSNALRAANRSGCLNPASAIRMYGCDAGGPAFEGWEDYGSCCLQKFFRNQAYAAKFLSGHLTTSAIEVTGAWATLDDSSGSVNDVAEVLRSHMPDVKVRISQTAFFVEYEYYDVLGPPIFNRLV